MRKSKFLKNGKPIAKCTDDEINQVYSIARAFADRKGRPWLRDEFASALMEDIFKSGYLYYNLHWRWARFLKEYIGDLKNKKGRAKSRARCKPVSIEKLSDDSTTKYSVPVDPTPLADKSDGLASAAKHLKKSQERMSLILLIKWGFTIYEIAEVLGVTHQRVQQILESAYTLLKARKIVLPEGIDEWESPSQLPPWQSKKPAVPTSSAT